MAAPDDPDGRLLVDAMCGTLATHLRMCGYDAAYALDRGIEDDDALRALADAEGRTVVTRDRELAAAADGVLLRSRDVEDQLRELADAGFDLSLDEPSRCGACNAVLDRVAPGETTPAYAPDADDRPVWRCPACGQHFWRGSHWADVARRLATLREE